MFFGLRTMRQAVALIALCAGLGTPVCLTAKDPIAVSVWPVNVITGGMARLKVIVERNDLNRAMTWEVDGPGYYRSSTKQLEGAESPRNYMSEVRDLPEGEFEVRATVRRADKSESIATCRILVLATSPRP